VKASPKPPESCCKLLEERDFPGSHSRWTNACSCCAPHKLLIFLFSWNPTARAKSRLIQHVFDTGAVRIGAPAAVEN
jgi:hypothetical protein